MISELYTITFQIENRQNTADGEMAQMAKTTHARKTLNSHKLAPWGQLYKTLITF